MTDVKHEIVAKVCNDCPFRRKAPAGWLGASPPELFVQQIKAEIPLPCHQTINYTLDDWKQRWERGDTGKLCRGALIFSTNLGKRSRKGPHVLADRQNFFATEKEFCDHHNNAQVKSWEFDHGD